MLIKHKPADAGFTLIEVMVALVIAAFALGVLFQGSIGGLRSARVAAKYQEALSRAHSHLATLVGQTGVSAGIQSGKDGGEFRWQTQVRPLGIAAIIGPATPTRPELFALRVTISWHGPSREPRVTLHSERLGATVIRT